MNYSYKTVKTTGVIRLNRMTEILFFYSTRPHVMTIVDKNLSMDHEVVKGTPIHIDGQTELHWQTDFFVHRGSIMCL